MTIPSLVDLAESGAHYGHHRSLTYPKAKNFVYAIKNNIALINLEETQRRLEEAQRVLWEYRQDKRPILFVGTKRSLRTIVRDVAKSIDAPAITERWFGGFLTNFPNFLAELKKMKELEASLGDAKTAKLEKKARLRLEEKLARYKRFLGDAANLEQMPELLIVASATEDKIALGEAQKLGVTIIAITDTDINPAEIDYPIPANDDAPKAVELILRSLVEKPGAKAVAEKVEKTEEEPKSEPKPKAKAVKKTTKKPAAKAKKTKTTTKKS